MSSTTASDRTPLLSDTSNGKSDYVEPPKPEVEEHYNIPGTTHKDFLWILIGIWSACFLGALDGTIVATLLSDIGSSFEKSNLASWLGTSYLLSICCFTPIYGRLCDILGRRGAMMTALFFFGIGTILCGMAPSMETLIAARGLAGVGGGGMMTVGNIIISDYVPLRRRGLFQGIANCFFGLGAGLGGPVGGLLSDTLGWRWAFLMQIPILCLSSLFVWFKVNVPIVNHSKTLKAKIARIDFLGSFTLVIAVSALLVALTFKTSADVEMPWSSPQVGGLLVVSGLFTVAFVLVEKYLSKEPIMPLDLVTKRTPAFVALSNFLVSILAFSMVYNLPLFFSAVRQTSSSVAGSHLVPNSFFLALGSVFAGWYMRHTGKYWWLTVTQGALSLIGCGVIATFSSKTPEWITWTAIIPFGFGVSGIITTTLIALIASVPREEIPVATGISYLFRTVGQVLGVALSGSLTQSLLSKQLNEQITGPGAYEIIERIRHSTASISHLPPDLKTIAIEAYASSLRVVFLLQFVFAFLTLLACAGMGESPLPDTAKPPPKPIEEEDA